MRITLIAPTPGPLTGSRTYATRVGALLAAHHTVHWATATQDPQPADVVHVLDAKHASGQPRPRAPFVVDLHDAYWTGTPTYPAMDGWLRRRRWAQQRPRMLKLLEAADAVIVHAPSLRVAVPHERVVVVPIPAEGTPVSAPEPHPELRVLFAGRDALRKGLPVLADALRESDLPVTLRLAGSDFPHLTLAARWWTRGIPTERVGELNAEGMAAAYAWADVVALPAYTEAFGLVAQEALVRGVPVIATRVGGLGELLAPLDGTLLVPPGDAHALAQALRTAHATRAALRAGAQRAGDLLRRERSPAAALSALESAYTQAMHGTSRGSR